MEILFNNVVVDGKFVCVYSAVWNACVVLDVDAGFVNIDEEDVLAGTGTIVEEDIDCSGVCVVGSMGDEEDELESVLKSVGLLFWLLNTTPNAIAKAITIRMHTKIIKHMAMFPFFFNFSFIFIFSLCIL